MPFLLAQFSPRFTLRHKKAIAINRGQCAMALNFVAIVLLVTFSYMYTRRNTNYLP